MAPDPDDEFGRVTDSSWFSTEVDSVIKELLAAARVAIDEVEAAREDGSLFTPVVALSLTDANHCLVEVKSLLIEMMAQRHPNVVAEAERNVQND